MGAPADAHLEADIRTHKDNSGVFAPRAWPPYLRISCHTDAETRVAAWWKPFTLGWDFVYVGVGKKGGD